jgi:hypothetical protein
LHDIASPLATTLFLVDILKDDVEEKGGGDSPEAKKLRQVHELLLKMKSMLEERRAVLIRSDGSDPKAA